MRVIGTAGHVDHGKSTLVKALTGIDPDRLKEEKIRQMTIDLGFAWYQDISGEDISIVDVPGHRDFIENMLSGIGAIDAVLLVIAADEGVMPQTREHLAVLDLLKINRGIVVLTKIDLVQDLDWLELITEDIQKVLQGTSLEGVEIVPVSAITGEGITDLKTKISVLLASLDSRSTDGNARLPIDRVFSMQGFGTIVTGTLGGGTLSTSEQIEIFPPGKTARIRGIQLHQKQVQKAFPGSRAALNLVGVEQSEIKRGGVVFQPGRFIPTSRIDTRVELLKDPGTGLKNNDVVKFFIATTETQARARLLGVGDLPQAGIGFVQFELSEDIIVSAHDRFILRRMSPAATIGGGVVINAHPAGRHRLNDKRVLEQLERRSNTNLEDQLLSIIEETPFVSREDLLQRNRFESEEFDATILVLLQSNRVIQLTSGHYLSYSNWKELANNAKKRVERFHQEHPLLVGLPFEVLCNQLGISKEIQFAFREFFQQEGTLEIVTNHVKITGKDIRYSTAQANRIMTFMDQITLDPNNPPSVKGSKEILGEEVYESLIDQGNLIQISPEVVLSQGVYQQMVEYVIDTCRKQGGITVIGFRDHFSTNRKTSLGLLEHLDSKGITKRQGEGRVLIKP